MKKVLLFSIIFSFFISLAAIAYETIIIDFPKKTKWDVAFYRNIGTEAILQYVPNGESYNKWTQTVIVHSYKDYTYSAGQLSDILTAQLQRQNPTGRYSYLVYSSVDAIAVRSTNSYNKIPAQSEIFRTTKAAEGLMTIQYIDRNKTRFKENYSMWLKIIRDARTYNSYWRDNRILNKSEIYEL